MPLLRTNYGRLWKKTLHQCLPEELKAGDCWIALSPAQLNGLILSGRVGKHTDSLAPKLAASTEGKTDCKQWHTDGWKGYERVLHNDEVEHYIGKILMPRLERTNGRLRQQTGRAASTTEQIWQSLRADESHLAFSHHLLQLDLGTFPRAGLQRLNVQT
jgi:IS1 family transposase